MQQQFCILLWTSQVENTVQCLVLQFNNGKMSVAFVNVKSTIIEYANT